MIKYRYQEFSQRVKVNYHNDNDGTAYYSLDGVVKGSQVMCADIVDGFGDPYYPYILWYPKLSRPAVYTLMASSANPNEWLKNLETVKQAFGGDLPAFWGIDITENGLLETLKRNWV